MLSRRAISFSTTLPSAWHLLLKEAQWFPLEYLALVDLLPRGAVPDLRSLLSVQEYYAVASPQRIEFTLGRD